MSAGVLSEILRAVTAEREATSTPWILESFVEISSAMPSLKYVLSGSGLRFCRGSTAMDGRTEGAAVRTRESLRYQSTPASTRRATRPMATEFKTRRDAGVTAEERGD